MRPPHLVLVLLFSLLAAGCVTHRDLASSAVTFNLAIEEAQNEMLLLNVIRSSQRRPMYISGIQKVTGGIRTEVSAGLEIPFGKASERNLLAPRASYSETPTFDVLVFDSQEFMRGFLAPIETKLLAYYWEDGWSPSLLLHLLVERIEVGWTLRNPVTLQTIPVSLVFDNYPDAEDPTLCHLTRFSLFAESFLRHQPAFRATSTILPVGPLVPAERFRGFEDLLAARQQSLDMTQSADGYQLTRKTEQLSVQVQSGSLAPLFREALKIAEIAELRKCRTTPPPAGQDGVSVYPQDADGVTAGTVTLYLRSPGAILYYLGELLRVEQEQERVPAVCIRGRLEPIFVAREAAAGCASGPVRAWYDGRRYVIPERHSASQGACGAAAAGEPPAGTPLPALGCEGGRSMQTLSLVSQIIGLQKSAKDLPTTSVVRTVGQ
jgi:hypothetical protein